MRHLLLLKLIRVEGRKVSFMKSVSSSRKSFPVVPAPKVSAAERSEPKRAVGAGTTAAKASLIEDGRVAYSPEYEVGASDKAGGLHVGPRSAGAIPGPVCYQIGGKEPTLTDADVVLGYIRPGKLANGDITIDLEAAHRAIHDCIAKPLENEGFPPATWTSDFSVRHPRFGSPSRACS